MIDNLISEFAGSISLSNVRLRHSPQLIFLCGGKYDSKSDPILSARHYFTHHLHRHHPDLYAHVRLAEKINDWYREGQYGDLLELEIHIAGLAASIVLFVESPGSIAELGSFAADKILAPKTIAIVEEHHHSGVRSFINDGPIARLQKTSADLVYVYQWLVLLCYKRNIL